MPAFLETLLIAACLVLVFILSRPAGRIIELPSYMIADEVVARIAHEANRAYCLTLGDLSHRAWNNTDDLTKQCTIRGVQFFRRNPGADASALHNNWMRDKAAQGYRYGPVKCPRALTHPCMVPFEQLPADQQFKDHLFAQIVRLASPYPAGF